MTVTKEMLRRYDCEDLPIVKRTELHASCYDCGHTRRLQTRVVALYPGTLSPIHEVFDDGCPRCIGTTPKIIFKKALIDVS